jgi:hypothetical protein
MNQTPAAILVLSAAVTSYAAHTASMTSHNQTAVILTLAALAMGIWGVISLIAASIRERELLIDGNARLEMLDQVMIREPLRALKQVARPQRYESQRALHISPELHAQLSTIAQIEGRDRSEILEETLREHLPKYKQTRVA